ncbi:6-pyruvoyl-tetrahydropterin synthase-related protein [Geomobilimonas luticola]|uniref:Membrane protein 6-pyruvoyl-tetrahydropterin synthase-related domain-containing protein n=1 Tax=Geomobilimonas luticola TaxID=1114878 RepID=A0ABS5SCP5_9BACT|nr:6-pyruvoyl-tetrahydropterin synthase-related protein [Geomobilimonas luticola]MBT0652955.1 hypothetical protein [Geomobilimonas luticola]
MHATTFIKFEHSNIHNSNNYFVEFIVVSLCLCLTASYCIMPLIIHQSLPYSHDMLFHVFQADQFSRGIAGGSLYPRWMADANEGLGSPTFIFYSPFSYYIVAIIHLVVPSFRESMTIAIWFSFFLSGLTMYAAVRKTCGKDASLLCAIIYQILPFHLLDLYARGTFAELYAYVWGPLVLLSLLQIHHAKKPFWPLIGLSASFSGLILTHLVTGYMLTCAIGLYIVYVLITQKERQFPLFSALGVIIGFGISSFYMIPVIFERIYVHIDYITKCTVCDYTKNFIFDLNNISDRFYQWLHISVTIELTVFSLIASKFFNKYELNCQQSKQGLLCCAPFILSFFLTTPISAPIWLFIPGFPSLQFPWRWILLMELFFCTTIASYFNRMQFSKYRVYLLTFIPLAIISATIIFKASLFHKELITSLENPIQNSKNTIAWEYVPIWASAPRQTIMNSGKEKMGVISGNASVRITEWHPEKREGYVDAATCSKIKVSTFYYPGWKLFVDGKETSLNIQDRSGLMMFDVPQGKHEFVIVFTDTELRRTAKIISVIALIMVMCFAIFVTLHSAIVRSLSK